MCGITGFLDRSGLDNAEELRATVRRMSNTLAHRGPDDQGVWADATCGLALGHRRLAVIDLSRHGHQPMSSACGRFRLVYNGEIYNHRELRRQLANRQPFFGHSDTEVLAAAIAQWGIPEAFRKSNGMFACAVWDRQKKELTLVRDRVGLKPLYYGWAGSVFLFGSELKALRAHRAFYPEINRVALRLYLQHNYIPAPYSIYQNIYKMPPGTLLTVPIQAQSTALLKPLPYWSMREVAERGQTTLFSGSDQEAVDELERLLRESIRLRLQADVPVGAFLSGGIDSSTVVALMQQESHQTVTTFSIGFDERPCDEAPYAKAVAKHLGTNHVEQYVTSREAQEVICCLPTLYDEPFADASQIPTFVVSQLARSHVTVSLSGDGGDELFGGYPRYNRAQQLWNTLGWVPNPWRTLTARVLNHVAPHDRPGLLARKTRSLARLLSADNPLELYRRLHIHWKNPIGVIRDNGISQTICDLHPEATARQTVLEQMMYLDSVTYLPDDILVKVDRASMGLGLEARVPLLDHHLVEFIWQLPLPFKIRNGQTKWLLRRLLDRHIPRKLTERPKVGFGIPLDLWLRKPLRCWAEELLDEKRLRDEGYLAPQPIRQIWKEHLSGTGNWQYHLWDVLMFQAWLDTWSAS